ncbi:hypothetical protein EYF80_003735 [Liparis tanakae]|uniref:Uncharacterized protein n=1 Tax=Liparis tanakae TaxID=230148 RepID=A0A4Z2J7G6_9TELE|nr:hypothetical protein EYF80_003735 [Liparis tanakae]
MGEEKRSLLLASECESCPLLARGARHSHTEDSTCGVGVPGAATRGQRQHIVSQQKGEKKPNGTQRVGINMQPHTPSPPRSAAAAAGRGIAQQRFIAEGSGGFDRASLRRASTPIMLSCPVSGAPALHFNLISRERLPQSARYDQGTSNRVTSASSSVPMENSLLSHHWDNVEVCSLPVAALWLLRERAS